MCTIYHVERAVDIKSNSMFNLTDLLRYRKLTERIMLQIWNYDIGMMIEYEKVSFNGCSLFTHKKNHHQDCIISSFSWFVDLFLIYAKATIF